MDSLQVIETYESILKITRAMLTAARNNEWEKLILLEQECNQLTNKLIQNEPASILNHEQQQRKVKIINQVLDDDAQIRSITEPWMTRLQDIISTTKHKRNLQQAYESGNFY